jgi:hypothetical protein
VLVRHVGYEPDGLVPDWLLGESDSRPLNPMARMNVEAAWMYGMKSFDEIGSVWTPTINSLYDVMPDGQSFLVNAADEDGAEQPLSLMMNWTAALRRP